MNLAQITTTLTQFTEELIADEAAVFLVDIKLKPGNNIQVFIDADNGLPLSKCIEYNRALYKRIEEAGLFKDGDFALEVSSPGLEEPLRLPRQYSKNIGRMVEVILKDGRKINGKLLQAGEHITIEEIKGKGKKQQILQHAFAPEEIKSTTIQIVFN